MFSVLSHVPDLGFSTHSLAGLPDCEVASSASADRILKLIDTTSVKHIISEPADVDISNSAIDFCPIQIGGVLVKKVSFRFSANASPKADTARGGSPKADTARGGPSSKAQGDRQEF